MNEKTIKTLAVADKFTFGATRYEVTSISKAAIYAKPTHTMKSGLWVACPETYPWEFFKPNTVVLVGM